MGLKGFEFRSFGMKALTASGMGVCSNANYPVL